MADQEINTLALVLRRFDFGESSQIAHLLTPVDGRISVLAKGIKKPNGYLKGPFDLFQLAQVRFLRRRHGDLGIMQRFEPLTGFAGLRQSLPAVFSAFYLGQLFYQGSTEENGDPSLFKLLARALGVLEEQGDRAHAAIVLATELRFLELLGFGPSWEHCARCDQPAASGKILFYPHSGGYFCSDCPPPPAKRMPLDPDLRQLIASLLRSGPRHAPRLRLSSAQHQALRAVMREIFNGVFERPLKSEVFLLNPRQSCRRPPTGSATKDAKVYR